jgi:hypothetical protein
MAHPGSEEAGGGLRHRDRVVPDWDTVREIADALPGAEESTTYGKPAFKVGGKLFTWISPDRHAGGALAVCVDPDEKELLLESDDAYFQTPHYDRHPIVLIRLEHISREQLEERIEDAWVLRAPKRLVDTYVAERG